MSYVQGPLLSAFNDLSEYVKVLNTNPLLSDTPSKMDHSRKCNQNRISCPLVRRETSFLSRDGLMTYFQSDVLLKEEQSSEDSPWMVSSRETLLSVTWTLNSSLSY